MDEKTLLTPKWPLSPRGTKWISGRYLWAEFFVKFSEKIEKLVTIALWEYNIYINRCPGAKVIPQKA